MISVVPENIHILSTDGNRNSEGRDGVQREAVSDQGIISGGSEEHC